MLPASLFCTAVLIEHTSLGAALWFCHHRGPQDVRPVLVTCTLTKTRSLFAGYELAKNALSQKEQQQDKEFQLNTAGRT